MVDHDNPADGDHESGTQDPDLREPTPPRRSTWAPAEAAMSAESGEDSESEPMSDDELADALAEDLNRLLHPVAAPTTQHTDDDDVAEPETVEAEAAEPELDEPEINEPEINEPPPTTAPIRLSLPMSELAATLAEQASDPENIDDVMAQLQEQLKLREHDAAEFDKWQESMLATGESEAIEEVESVRSNYSDLFAQEPRDDSDAAHPASDPVDAAPSSPTEFGESATHIFRMDEALESDLISAPAPMSAPMTDIPPPPGHMITSGRGSVPPPTPETAEVAEDDAPSSIPELIEPAPASTASPGSFDFDSLLSGAASDDDEPTAFSTEPHGEAPVLDDTSESILIAPEEVDVDAPDSVLDDDVADNDRVFAAVTGAYPVTSEGITTLPEPAGAPIEPVYSRQIPTAVPASGATTAVAAQLRSPAAFRVEESSIQPTAEDQRVGKAARLFWLWFAANSSVVSVAFGGAVFSLGMSLRQAIVATLIGVAISFLPLGLGTLAGKWSGQPTMIVSRATFGHVGNILPAVFALVVRVFWGAVLLWFLAAGTSRILVGAELSGPLGESQVTIIGLAVGFLLALVIAYFGYGLIARIQLAFTIISAILIIGLIVITWPAVNISAALTVGDGPWILVVTGAVLVFSFVGLVWAVSSADLARYQRPGSSGTASMLWSTFGATIPAFTLIAYGAVLAASNPEVAIGLVETPLDTIALLIPIWYPVPLIAALALSLLSGVVISIYSGGFALQGTGATMRRSAAVVIVGVAVAAVAIGISLSVGDFVLILRDLATSLAVPMAAWAGIFGAEMMIRNRGFNSQALLQRGGLYPDVNWVNLAMLVVATVVGFGLTTATVSWLGWQGYLFSIFGVPLTSDLAGTDLGVFVALILGLLTPIVAGIPSIRRQERGAN